MPLVITLSTDPEHLDSLLASLQGLNREPQTESTEAQTPLEKEDKEAIPLIENVSLTIINDPQTLSLLAAQIRTPSPFIPLTTPSSHPYTLAKSSLKNLRLSLLGPLPPFATYTESERVGEAGPTTSPLIQAWREAYRALPRHHAIETLQWDVRHPEAIRVGNLVERFMQEVSTGMYVKAKAEMGREMMFGVVGWESVGQKRFLMRGLPGRKVVVGYA